MEPLSVLALLDKDGATEILGAVANIEERHFKRAITRLRLLVWGLERSKERGLAGPQERRDNLVVCLEQLHELGRFVPAMRDVFSQVERRLLNEFL